MVLQACMKVVENTNIFQDCRLLGSEYVKDASSETSAHTYRTAWLYILGANLHSTRRGSLKTQPNKILSTQIRLAAYNWAATGIRE